MTTVAMTTVATTTAPSAARRNRPGDRLDRVGEVFDLVRTGRCRTMSELAAATGLARSTVAQRVEPLLASGLIRTGSDDRVVRGRPPQVLEFNPSAGSVLVAHLGITAVRVAVTDLAGAILADAVVPRPIGDQPDGYLDELSRDFDAVLATAGLDRDSVRGVALGLPSAIELSTARSQHGVPARAWADHPIADKLSANLDVPVFVDTDVTVLALGEQRLRWPEEDVLVCIKAGSVMGAGIVSGGRPVRGAHALAGSIGHSRVPDSTAACLCGNTGCLDAAAGGAALVAAVRRAGLVIEDVRDVARLAAEGEPAAVQAVRQAGRCIGEVLAGVVNLVNPGVIAVWGYLVEAEEPLLAGIRETLYRASLPAVTRSLTLVPAGLGARAGLYGAATLALDNLLAPETVDAMLVRD